MAAVVESQVAGLELEKVRKKVEVAFETDRQFYNTIKKRPVEVISNRQMRVPLKLRTGGSFSYFNPDGGDLGRGGGPTYDKAVLNSVFMVEAIEYTKLTQWSTTDARKAVIMAVRDLTAGALEELQRQIDAQLQGTGNGVIGTVTTDTPAGGSNVITCTTDGFGVRLMRYGQTVQIYDATLATLRGSGDISFYDVENKTINITPQIAGVIATDLIVVNGISSPTSLPALFGIKYHHSNASTGTWLGFARSTTPEVRSNRVNAASAFLSLPLPRLAINKIGNRVGKDNRYKPKAWAHPAQQQSYEDIGQLISSIDKKPNEKSLDLYFEKYQLAGAPLETHFNCDNTRIDFIVEELWGRGEILPIGFYKSDGRSIFEIRGASGGVAAADIFYMVNGFQTFVANPAGTAYIDNLAVPAGY